MRLADHLWLLDPLLAQRRRNLVYDGNPPDLPDDEEDDSKPLATPAAPPASAPR